MTEELSAAKMENLDSVLNQYQYLEKCLHNLAKSLRDKPGNCRRLAKAFPEIYRDNPEVLQLISDESGEKYEGALKDSYDQLIKRYELKEKISKLAVLPTVQNEGWRPTGDPDRDMQAHIALQKQKNRESIRAEITKEDEEIAKLVKVLAEKEKLIEEKMLHVNSLNEDVLSASRIALSAQDVLQNP